MADEESQLRAECRRLREALALAERERQLLGYEIHDDVVQELTAAAMLLEGAARQASFAAADGQENYSGGLRLLHQAIAKARGLIRGMAGVEPRPDGLIAGLSQLVERFKADHGLPVSMECHAANFSLTEAEQHLLLRIAQESLFNTWKHARATAVEVRLAEDDGRLTLTIEDNGLGFEPATVPPGHYGLEGIRARAHLLGADLLLDTAPKHGCRVVVRMPPRAL